MTGKYRAKRKHDGEWVIGCYIPPAHYFGDGKTHGIEHILPNDESGVSIQIDVVDPDTLSRCSGLTACGQEVYEGDIVRFYIDHTSEFWTAVVRFGWHDTYEYGWYLEPIRDTVFTKQIGTWLGENPAFRSTAAVVGNVWDNPELMGKKSMNDDEILKSLRDIGMWPVVWKDLIVTFPDKSHFVKCPECGTYTDKMRVPTNRDWLNSLSPAELVCWIKNTASAMSDVELMRWMEEKYG